MMDDERFRPPDRNPVGDHPTEGAENDQPETAAPWTPQTFDVENEVDAPVDLKRTTDSMEAIGGEIGGETGRRGRARERVEKRRAARGTTVNPNPFMTPVGTSEVPAVKISDDPNGIPSQAGSTESAVRHTAAISGSRFALPASEKSKTARKRRRSMPPILQTFSAIRLPFSRFLLIPIGSILFVVAVVVVLGLVRNRPSGTGVNALWVGEEWTSVTPDATQMAEWAEDLQNKQIGTLFAWVSQLTPERTWFGESTFEDTAAFAAAFRVVYPSATLYGWVRVPVDGVSIQLDDAVRTQIADFSRRVVDEMGFEGVMLQVDPVVSADENYLSLLRAVRNAIGDAPLAVAVPPDWTPVGAGVPQPPQIAPGTMWDAIYKQRVALLVDEIVVQTYNTGFSSPNDYSAWIAHQVGSFTSAIASLEVDVNLYIGIPTYDANPPRYNPAVENIASAALGLRDGVSAAGENAVVLRGVALYAEWTTDADEWETLRREWTER